MNKKSVFFLTIYLAFSTPSLADIRILNPWVSASTGPDAILFMEIENTGNTPDKLISVDTTRALRTELHNHVDTGNGRLHMAKINFIGIPARGFTRLIPGGQHVMLRGIHGPLREGEVVQVSLHFESGQGIQVNAPVRAKRVMD